MPRSLFPQGLIGSLGFLWHFGNVKCYISAKGHYLELPPSPQHAGAADAGEKWPAGKTPNWKSMFTLRLHWEDVQAAKGEFKSPFLSPHRGDTQCKGSVGAEAMQESLIPQRATALLLTAQGRDCSPCLSGHISDLWQLSVTPPNTQPEQQGCFSEPFTEPPPHLHLTRLSQYSQEKHSNKKYPNTYTTLHVLIPEGRQTTFNSCKVWLSPFLALLASQTPQAGFRSCEVKGHESTRVPSSMGSSRHVLEQGWETKQSRWPADYTSPKP